MRLCENCNRELPWHWWELQRREEIPVPGEGGGIHSRFLAQFCNPTCIEEWFVKWRARKEISHDPNT
jgi:hypothetical protein